MPDDVFSPWPFPGNVVAPGSAEVLYLRRALCVIQGTYFDPLKAQNVPLPPHRWALVHSVDRFLEGGDSDNRGISTLFEGPELAGVEPDAVWDLLLIPLFPGRADSDDYGLLGEAWIDIESGEWVPGAEIRVDVDRPFAKVYPRKVLRIPLWSTKRKIEMGGGFEQTFPHSPDFATTGEIKTSELKPHGNPTTPWILSVDHGLLRTHVQFRYYDPLAKREKPVPAGMMVLSLAQDLTLRGASTTQLPDGSTYVLHAHDVGHAGDFNYALQTIVDARFAFADPKLESATAFDIMDLGTHYFVPASWGSVGQEAWEGAVDASAAARKPFAELRAKGQERSRPLSFHLDDVAFVDVLGSAITLAGDRICLMDHDLAIKRQASVSGNLVPYSDVKVKRLPLRAEEMVFVRGEGIRTATRVMEYEGQIFELTRKRTAGIAGRDALVGTKAAHLGELRFGRDFENYELYVIDTRYLKTAYEGQSHPLAHALVHVSCFLSAPTTDNDSNGKNEAATKGLPKLEHTLWQSTLRWQQKHPAFPAGEGLGGANKEYVLIPQRGLSAADPILRIRYHFGSRLNAQRIDLGGMKGLGRITIELHPQAGRATGGDPMHLYLVFGPKIVAPPVPVHPKADEPFDFERSGDLLLDRLDDVGGIGFTLAHELGHSMRLPDEYLERMRVESAGLPEQLFQWRQSSEAKPYNLDNSAMMRSNQHPRLRYSWLLSAALERIRSNVPKDHFLQQAWIGRYVVKGKHATELRYNTTPSASFLTRSPWEAVNSGKVNHVKLWLFRASDDEGIRGPLFYEPSKLVTPRFDGLLVVHTDFWFDFRSIFDPDDQWRAMYTRFGKTYFDREKTPHFFIESGADATDFKQVALIVQPRFEFGPKPSELTPASGTTPATFADVAQADVHVVVGTSKTRVITPGTPPKIEIHEDAVGNWLMRYALDPIAHRETSTNLPLTDADFISVKQWLATELKRTPGTIRPF